MNPKDDKANAEGANAEEAHKGPPPRRFDSTLPHAKKGAPDGEKSDDLDLDLGDIQSRLPYGSEDIADK